MEQGKYNIKPTYYGATKNVLLFDFIDSNYTLIGASATLIVYNDKGVSEKTYSVGNGLTINSATQIQKDKELSVTIPVGKKTFELTFHFQNGENYPFIAGNWEIR